MQLHRSLTAAILLAGAPRTPAIVNGTLGAAIAIGLQLWIAGTLVWLIGHALLVWGAKMDPQFIDAFSRHVKHAPFLDV